MTFRAAHLPTRSVPADELKDEKIARIGAHSDFGSITLLLQDDAGGLEIEDPNHPGQFKVGVVIAEHIVHRACLNIFNL